MAAHAHHQRDTPPVESHLNERHVVVGITNEAGRAGGSAPETDRMSVIQEAGHEMTFKKTFLLDVVMSLARTGSRNLPPQAWVSHMMISCGGGVHAIRSHLGEDTFHDTSLLAEWVKPHTVSETCTCPP